MLPSHVSPGESWLSTYSCSVALASGRQAWLVSQRGTVEGMASAKLGGMPVSAVNLSLALTFFDPSRRVVQTETVRDLLALSTGVILMQATHAEGALGTLDDTIQFATLS